MASASLQLEWPCATLLPNEIEAEVTEGFWESLWLTFGFCFSFFGLPWWLEEYESACSVGDLGLISGLRRSFGEGNDNPLQYSYLENSMDKGSWLATAHGVAKSQTQLNNFHVSFFARYPPCCLKYRWEAQCGAIIWGIKKSGKMEWAWSFGADYLLPASLVLRKANPGWVKVLQWGCIQLYRNRNSSHTCRQHYYTLLFSYFVCIFWGKLQILAQTLTSKSKLWIPHFYQNMKWRLSWHF